MVFLVSTASSKAETGWNASALKLSGYWEDDIVAVAQSLVDYDIRPSGETIDASQDRNWSAGFVSFCARMAQIPLDLTAGSVQDMEKNGLRYRSYHMARNHKPEKGDIFFAREEGQDCGKYCGIVEQVTQTVIYAIEGNEEARIERKVYFKDDPLIYGYISIWDLMRADGIIVIEDTAVQGKTYSEEAAGKKEASSGPSIKEDEYFFLLNQTP